ncbi:uncharacterized protein L201_002046 [Kwoniella dendrophila CBS 6074]|uniref:CSC1/OSCA1-like 7TM region domain-containing protein n=1 Tax=Kwoniella dendrophila CBS 6074 TaxID=1295534 RepID=A0AAX4JP37_9TREE
MAPFVSGSQLAKDQLNNVPTHPNMIDARQHATHTYSTNTPTASTVVGLSAEDFIKQADNHWDVSATSILAAWVATLIGIFLILLLYSTVRLKWRRIYLPRLKLRKPSQAPDEKEQDKIKLSKLDKKGQKEYMIMKYNEEPDFYPGFKRRRRMHINKTKSDIDDEKFEWVESKDNGIWVGKAPKAPITFFGWMRASWEETKIELSAIIPKSICCCWDILSLRSCVRKKGQGKRPTILQQDIKLLKMIGLDAVIYLMFLRLLKYLFATISIFATLLAFANYYINTQTSYGSTHSLFNDSNTITENSTLIKSNAEKFDGNITNIIDNPNLLTAANITSNALLVHISFEIIVTMLVIIFVLKASAHHSKLINQWAYMNRNEISFKTLFITNLSISRMTNGEAKQKIKTLVLGDYSDKCKSSIWFAVHKLNPLERKIEKFKKKAFSNAIKAVALETFYQAQSHSSQNKSYLYDSCWHRFIGKSKNARTKVNEALREKHQIEEEQQLICHEQDNLDWKSLDGTVTAAFVSLPTAKLARDILQDRKRELSQAGYTLEKAPRTHNVLWRNLEKDAKSRHSHAIFGKLALIVVCFLNTIPVMGIVLLTNIGIAIDRYPKLAEMQEESQFWKVIFMVIEGVLPATVAAIFSYLLPYIMRELNRWSGAITRGQLDKDQTRQVFIFLLISNFVVFALIGVLYETISGIYSKIGQESIQDIYTSLGDLPAKITRAYISQSLYWFSWYPIRSIVMWLQLLQVPRLLLKTPQLLKFKTPQDLAEVTLAIHFEIFAMCVGLIYAPLAPIVVIGATLHFWSAHIVHSQSLKYVNDAKETDGECWWVIINRLLVGTVLMQCLMVLTVTLKTQSPAMAVIAALPIFLIFLFKLYLNKNYNSDINIVIPSSSASSSSSTSSLKKGNIEKLDNEEIFLEKYEPDILKFDWMPKGKTVKNRKLMNIAKKKIPGLQELMYVKSNPNSNSNSSKRQFRANKQLKRLKNKMYW